jgi:hypothetical protein
VPNREHAAAARDAEAEALPAPPEAAGPTAGVLGLQRSVGNAAVAHLLARGGQATLARLITGNPTDIPVATNPAGAVTDTGTTHAAPGIADAVNHMPSAAPVAGRSVMEMNVKPKATPLTPIEAETVAEEDLYEVDAASRDASSPPPAGFSTIDEIRGDPTGPIVDESADESLFIEGGPKPDDVQQGGIGDCWEMATLIEIANRDPGKITGMMAPDGSGGAAITFYRRQVTPPGPIGSFFGMSPDIDYVPEVVQATNELAFNRSAASAAGTAPATDAAVRTVAAGRPYGRSLRGAQLRAAPRPISKKWWAQVVDRRLEIHRLDTYQMARWLPLLEKSGARFSERYGQYGHSGAISSENEKNAPNQGYANISGGYPGYVWTMFYGKDGESMAGGTGDTAGTAWNPAASGTSALLSANQAAFDRLLTLAGRGSGHQAGDTTAPMVTARAVNDDIYINRLGLAIPAATADPDWTNVAPAAQTAVNAVPAAVTAYQSATPDPNPPVSPPPPGSKSVTKQALVTAARACANPPDATLSDPARSQPIKNMLDLLLVVKNMPVDWSRGSRSVYSGHEYAVLSLNILSTSGGPSNIHLLPAFMRPALYSQVDVNASTVTLMNPHHGNVPDATGTGPDTGGVFTVSLSRFFLLYAGVQSAQFDIPSS